MLWLNGKVDGHRQGELRASDGVLIPYRQWQHPAAKAALLYMHGQGDHTGSFTAMGDRLHEAGYMVYAHDHRGFGLSRERRGDIRSYEYYIRDALQMIQYAKAQSPQLPLILMGYSMGGHIAMRTACRASDQLAGVVALSPGFKLRSAPKWSAVVRSLFYSLLAPGRYIVAPLSKPIVTNRNPLYQAQIAQDEYWVTRYTARFYLGTVLSLRKARREISRLRLPVLMLQSGEDYLISPEESKRFFDLIPHANKRFRLLEGVYHNVVVDPEMPAVVQEIAEWIESLVGRR